MQTVVIAGVGLIGGSFALALRKSGFAGRILGVSSEATLRRALDLGVIDEGRSLSEALPQGDLVMLAQPISRILDLLPLLDPHLREGALVTDVGSTKREIAAAAERHLSRGIFAGGHPMAGKESRGVEQADADLFRGRTWFLTVPERAEGAAAVAGFKGWIERIGATPVEITPAGHDRLVAFTSHLPQLVATALAGTLARSLSTDDAVNGSGPGLRDMTRLAKSDFEIWADIVGTNIDGIAAAIDCFLAQIQEIARHAGTPEGAGKLEREFQIAANFARKLRKSDS